MRTDSSLRLGSDTRGRDPVRRIPFRAAEIGRGPPRIGSMRPDIRLFLASRDLERLARTEPPKSAAETIGRIRAMGRLIGRSLVRFRRGPSPKTPRTRGNFGAVAHIGSAVSAPPDYMAEEVIFELSVGESRANPNRRTWQQRQMPTAAPSKPVTRSLRFGFARALAQNPAQPRGFGGPTRVPTSPSPETQTEWRREWDSNPR